MYKFIRNEVLSKHRIIIIMKAPIPNATSERRLIPTLIPEIVEDVAIAVMNQIITTCIRNKIMIFRQLCKANKI